jgi:hypothetical protein
MVLKRVRKATQKCRGTHPLAQSKWRQVQQIHDACADGEDWSSQKQRICEGQTFKRSRKLAGVLSVPVCMLNGWPWRRLQELCMHRYFSSCALFHIQTPSRVFLAQITSVPCLQRLPGSCTISSSDGMPRLVRHPPPPSPSSCNGLPAADDGPNICASAEVPHTSALYLFLVLFPV